MYWAGGCISHHVLGMGGVYPSMHWQGVSAQGVSTWGCLPRGVCPEEVSARGGVCQGGYLPRGVWQTPSLGPEAADIPPLNRMTDWCKNITLPQLRAVKRYPPYDKVKTFTIWRLIAGCGGNLTDVNGTFTSPGYPGAPAGSKTCTWRIKVVYLRARLHVPSQCPSPSPSPSKFNIVPIVMNHLTESHSVRRCNDVNLTVNMMVTCSLTRV